MNVGDLVKVDFGGLTWAYGYVGLIVNVREGRDEWGITSDSPQDSEYDVLFAGRSNIVPVYQCEIIEVIKRSAPK
jgi:hypothetical protein